MHSEDLRGISKLMIFAEAKCGLQYVSLSFYGPFLPCQTLLKALEEIFYKNRRGVCPELQEFLVIGESIGSIIIGTVIRMDFCRFLPFFSSNLGDISDRLKVQI